MEERELEILLKERCKALDLKKKAFESLDEILIKKNSNDKEFLCGFEQAEIKTVFDGFSYKIDRRHGESIISTRIGLYIESQLWIDNLEQIGFYELESDFGGEILDDWLVIEKEKEPDKN